MTLRIEELYFHYEPHAPVLVDISVALRPGGITALIGPNAAGKSTLLRCMIGQLRPVRGRVLLDDYTVHRVGPSTLAQRIAYVSQRPTVGALFTVRQVVELGRYALPPDDRRVDEAMELLDVWSLRDRPFSELSVGQQQRVMLARAVAQLPRDRTGVLLLDEPTSALDLSHVFAVTSLLGMLTENGASVVWAVHDLSLAARCADDVWLLDQGKLVAAGSARDVLDAQRLHEVFEVEFEWIERAGRSPALLADAEHGSATRHRI